MVAGLRLAAIATAPELICDLRGPAIAMIAVNEFVGLADGYLEVSWHVAVLVAAGWRDQVQNIRGEC